MIIKKEIRIVGWDDGPFPKGEKGKVPVIGSIFRGGSFLDGLLKIDVEIDGMDATDKIIESIKKTKHEDLRIIMTDGITFGGFNVIDIEKIHKETELPVIVIIRKKPNMEKFINAMSNLDNFEERKKCVEKAGKFYEAKSMDKIVYFQKIGLSEDDAKKVINISCTRSVIPEAIRVSHIIASGIVKGESIGRA